MTKAVGLLVALFGLWLALSGYFTPFLLTLGVLSCALTIYLASRMKLLDEEAVPLQLRPALLFYWGWLAREIFKSAIAVSRVILARNMSLAQQLIAVPSAQKTEMGHVIFANSITLTPGTITVEMGQGKFLVHALTEEMAGPEGFADMGARVARIEER